ncbi:MAG: M15 family metallopeptidase [Spirochaetes bacterium]|nr:M15 family metallopeptidase [Spirochaetota bacterium]MBN2769650.1 M15 family metallopeptidase [Spirochaetota bacterium]
MNNFISKYIIFNTLFVCFALISSCAQYQIGSEKFFSQFSQRVIVDCDMTLNEALANVPEECPESVVDNLALIEVFYYSFDNRIHRGQILADYRHAEDIHAIFTVILRERFPIYGCIPIDHSSYEWVQFNTVPEGNSYSFHYRNIVYKNTLSYHSFGHAIDINPIINPFRKWGTTFPKGGTYDPQKPGTLYEEHPVVLAFKKHGWYWGGNWRRRDYQHFQKPIKGENDIHIVSNPGIIRWPNKQFSESDGSERYYTTNP